MYSSDIEYIPTNRFSMSLLDYFGSSIDWRKRPAYVQQTGQINLIGHGSIIMWNNMQQFHEDIEPKLEYCCRNIPEYMNKYNK